MLVVVTVRAEMGNITDHCTGHYTAVYSTENALHSTENALYCTENVLHCIENVLWVQCSVGTGEPPSSWTIPWCRYLCTYNMLHSLNCIALKMHCNTVHSEWSVGSPLLVGQYPAFRHISSVWVPCSLIHTPVAFFRKKERKILFAFSSGSPLPLHTRTSCILKDLFL